MRADAFIAGDLEPVHRRLSPAELDARVDRARALLDCCRACPRACAIDRGARTRVCATGRLARLASAGPHRGEEAVLSGWRGSGTLFFAGCNLRCVFCQNWDISQRPAGRAATPAELAARMLELEAGGCHNVNLVTPSHVAPQLVEALVLAVRGGLTVPVVYNTSAYDAPAALALLDGLVDVYMPDFKVWSPRTAARLLKAKDYPAAARGAIAEMHRQVGVLRVDRDGLARRGLLVRHLVVPGLHEETAAILGWLARELSPDTYVNVMDQYHPDNRVRRDAGAAGYPEIARLPSQEDLAAARAAATAAGLWRLA